MATTLRADLWAPEVWADMAAAEFTGKAIVATSTAVLTDDTLVGQPGETINFPKWMELSEMQDVAETDVLVPEKLTQKASAATIKEAGKAVEISDKASLVGLGNPQDEAVRQFGVLAARKVDADLITAAQVTVADGVKYADGSAATASAPLTHTITNADGAITWDGIVDGLEKFGDDFEPSEFSGLYIRAEQRSQIMKDDAFIKASEVSAGGAGSMLRRGFIGEIAGLPVYVTNRLGSGKALVLKQNSLGLFYKRRPIVEQDRDILSRTTVVTTNLHYATKRVNDKGVLALTIATGARSPWAC
ncbi:N4-gp56 family major capsid protein [Aeromicrobium phragmitis]|uniref:N4-gp56 family major capsid protein n=1 Tax=Aeromicrobium phragmitis TaxID=2478914 RepID=A0A3L8PKY9_9ACTN|nr:N4-gp56 family major capsid protein [Aeromicrobium phragmitis]RLV56055.1 N4-gp56 family major capsid protein [Aeromicrobium phragmitis]